MEEVWNLMPVNLSIKNAPDEVVQRLRQRAERHHRSLQGELLAIIEEAVIAEQELTPAELLACQTARKRDPLWAPKRDPFFTVFERRGA
jgi:plasmid stability protein